MGKDVINSQGTGVGPTEANSGSNAGRQRRRRNNSRRRFNRPGTPGATAGDAKTSKFERRRNKLKGHVQNGSNARQAADKFTKTTKEIAEYAGTKYSEEVTLESDLKKAYLLVYRQCSDAQKARLESISNQATIAANTNLIGL